MSYEEHVTVRWQANARDARTTIEVKEDEGVKKKALVVWTAQLQQNDQKEPRGDLSRAEDWLTRRDVMK